MESHNSCTKIIPTLKQFNLKNQTILIRADLNVPINNGIIADDSRIKASLETIQYCLNQGAKKVLVISHLGRPVLGGTKEENLAYSLHPVAKHLEKIINHPVFFVSDWKNFDFNQSSHNLFLLENIRFESGETSSDIVLSQKIASLADIVVIDAFGTAHRKHASTYGAVHFSKKAAAGLLLQKEIESLSKALLNPKPEILAIVGGAKVSTKLMVLENLITKVNHIILGGGIINTFLMAKGYSVGSSLVEKDLVPKAQEIMDIAKKHSVLIHLPDDVVVTDDFNNPINFQTKSINEVANTDIIMDVGDKSADKLAQIIHNCQTILWNGPLGVFEHQQFANGTKKLTMAICQQTKNGAFSIAGGGDTIAAINKFNAANQVSYISTGGGAFLEFIEGKELPVVSALLEKSTINF